MKKLSKFLALAIGVSTVLSTVVMPINVSASVDEPMFKHFDFNEAPDFTVKKANDGSLHFAPDNKASYKHVADPLDPSNMVVEVTMQPDALVAASSGHYTVDFVGYDLMSTEIVAGSYYYMSARVLANQDLTNVSTKSANMRAACTSNATAFKSGSLSTTRWGTTRGITYNNGIGGWDQTSIQVTGNSKAAPINHYFDDYIIHEIRAVNPEKLGTTGVFKITGPEDLGLVKNGITITDGTNTISPRSISYADGIWSIGYTGLNPSTDYQLMITSVFNNTTEGSLKLEKTTVTNSQTGVVTEYEKRMFFNFTTKDIPTALVSYHDFTQTPDFSIKAANNAGKIYFGDDTKAEYAHVTDPLDETNKVVKVTLKDAAKVADANGYYPVQFVGFELTKQQQRDDSYYFVSAKILADKDDPTSAGKGGYIRATCTSNATPYKGATLSNTKWSTSRGITYNNGIGGWQKTYLQVTTNSKAVSVNHYFDDYRIHEILALNPDELNTTGVFRITGPEDLGLIKEGITITDGTNSFTPTYVWYNNGFWNIAYENLERDTEYQVIITSVFNGTPEGAIKLEKTVSGDKTYEKRMIFDFVTVKTNLLSELSSLTYQNALANGQTTLEKVGDAWLMDRSSDGPQAALASAYLTPGATYYFKANVKYADPETETNTEFTDYYLPGNSEAIYDTGNLITSEYATTEVIFKYPSNGSVSAQKIGVRAPYSGTDNLLVGDYVLEQLSDFTASGEVSYDGADSATITYVFSENIENKLTKENFKADNGAVVSNVTTNSIVAAVELDGIEKGTDYTVSLSNVVNGIGQKVVCEPVSFTTGRKFDVTSNPENGACIHNSNVVTLTFTNKPLSFVSGTDVTVTKAGAPANFSIATVSENEETGEFVYALNITEPEYNKEYTVAINVADSTGQTITKNITFMLTSPENLLNVWKNTSGQAIGGSFEHSDYASMSSIQNAENIEITEAAAYEGNYGLSFTANAASGVEFTDICPDWTYEQLADKEQNNVLFVSFYAKAAAGSGNPKVRLVASGKEEQTNIMTVTCSSSPAELNESGWVKVFGYVVPKQNINGENKGFDLGVLVDDATTNKPTIYVDNFEVVEIARLNLNKNYMAYTNLSDNGTLEVVLDNSNKQATDPIVFVVTALADESGRLSDIKLNKIDFTQNAQHPAISRFTGITKNHKLFIWDVNLNPITSEMSLDN